MKTVLEAFFAPRSVAVIGASRDPGKVGHAVLRNLLEGGFAGPVHPVNPSGGEILGRRAYENVGAVPPPVDLAVIVVPAGIVATTVAECGAAGVRAAIVISAGFRETGPAGAALEKKLVSVARSAGVRLLGPNCLGLIAARAGLNASFAPVMPTDGPISFMSQSGALGTAVLDWAAGEGIGIGHFVSLGNKADVTEVDLLRAWTADPESQVVVAYLESVSDGPAFVDAVTTLVRKRPFVALTAGSTDAGARAMSSHTGSLAGSRAAYDAAFLKCGAIGVRTVEELFDLAEGFARQPLPEGPRVAILTNAGGPAILAADACEDHGVLLAALDGATVAALAEVLPPAAAIGNPVDILGDADADRYLSAARLLAADPGVDALVVILTPQAMTQPVATAEAVSVVARESHLTTLAVFMGDVSVVEAVGALRAGGVPEYAFPERAISTLGSMIRHRVRMQMPLAEAPRIDADRPTVTAAIAHATAAGRTFITEATAQRIATSYGIGVPRAGVASDLAGALALASDIGYPVVLKIASPDILHKSDIGGIALGLTGPGEVRSAYERMMAGVRRRMPEARIWGVSVQEQLPPGHEVIIGVHRDPTFGPLVMFGLGGIYVEVLHDVTFRLAPVTLEEAREMIGEIRAAGILRGARGAPPADVDAIADVIVRVAALAHDFDSITELDINPLIVGDRGQGAVAADIRIGIGG